MTPAVVRRSSGEVRETILKEATALFVAHGYAGTSMNELNARVGGSKVTLYKHFGNKRKLFAAVLDHVLADHMAQLDAVDFDSPDLEGGLEAIARQTLGTVSSPEAMGLWRLLYVEAPRSRYLGELFISHGPAKSLAGIERFFARHAERGHLRCRDPKRAADYFLGMLLHKPMLYRYVEMEAPLTRRQLGARARRVSRDFLRMCEAL